MIGFFLAWALTTADIETKPWMQQSIKEQLHAFPQIQENIVAKSYAAIVQSFHEKHCPLALVTIREGKVSFKTPEHISKDHEKLLPTFAQCIELLHSQKAFPDCRFILWLDQNSDRPAYLRNIRVPVFAIAKPRDSRHIVLLPKGVFDPKRSELFKTIEKYDVTTPWHTRAQSALWHIHPLKNEYQYVDWEFQAPIRFVLLTRHYPSDLALNLVAFGRRIHWGLYRLASKMQIPFTKGAVSTPPTHRYLLALEQMGTYQDLEWQLLSGSAILKGPSHLQEWYSDKLMPHVHYLPISSHGEDLIERIEWAREHDDLMHSMAENSKRFAKEYLSDASMFSYLYEAVSTYAKRCQR